VRNPADPLWQIVGWRNVMQMRKLYIVQQKIRAKLLRRIVLVTDGLRKMRRR